MIPDEVRLSCRRVFVENLRVAGRLGILEKEMSDPQTVVISVSVWVAKSAEGGIADTLDYRTLADMARQTAGLGRNALAEDIVREMASRLSRIPGVAAGCVSCRKPYALPEADACGAEEFFVSEGSN